MTKKARLSFCVAAAPDRRGFPFKGLVTQLTYGQRRSHASVGAEVYSPNMGTCTVSTSTTVTEVTISGAPSKDSLRQRPRELVDCTFERTNRNHWMASKQQDRKGVTRFKPWGGIPFADAAARGEQ